MLVPEKKDTLHETYTLDFFRQHQENLPAYDKLAQILLSAIEGGQARSFVDVGCGHGLLVECLRALGVSDAYGVDGSESARGMWPNEYAAYYRVADLGQADAATALPKTQVVCSFETAEHLPPDAAERFIGNLTAHRPQLVVFGAATPFQDLGRNPTHVNEQAYGYWIDRFKRVQYTVDIPATVHLRNRMFEQFAVFARTWWYPKNLLVFNRVDGNVVRRLIRADLASPPNLRWFSRIADNPLLDLVFERDKYEYLYLVESYLRSAAANRAAIA